MARRALVAVLVTVGLLAAGFAFSWWLLTPADDGDDRGGPVTTTTISTP